jgi:hypothetical protein
MQFFVYDNDARRYHPRPDRRSAETLPQTDQIEELVTNLRKVDIGDVYFNGEHGILAHRIRARSSLPQYQERNQEHFAVWRTESGEPDETLFEGAAKDLSQLFDRPEWEMPPEPDADRGDYISDPQQVLKLAEDSTFAKLKQSEAEASRKLELIATAADGEYNTLNIGVQSFDDARRLLRLLSHTRGAILVGDFNKPDEFDRLDPDVIITYDSDYGWLQLLDSDTEEALEIVKQSLENERRKAAMDEIDEGLRRLREEPTYSIRDELAVLNRLLPMVSDLSGSRRPQNESASVDLETLPDPAQTTLTGIRRLHELYDFDESQTRPVSRWLTSERRRTDSPFARVAEKLTSRREKLRQTLYERQAETVTAAINDAVADLSVTSEDENATRQQLLQELLDSGRNQPQGSRAVLVGGGMTAGAVIILILLGVAIPFVGIPLDFSIAQQAGQLSPSVSDTTITMDSEVHGGSINVSGETTADRVTVQIVNASSQVRNTTTRVRGGQFTVEHPITAQGTYTVIVQAGGARAESQVLFDRPVQLTLRRPTWGETVSIQQNESGAAEAVRIAGTTNVDRVYVSARTLSNESVIQSQTIKPANGSFTTQLNLTAGHYLVAVTADDHVGANTTVMRPVNASVS